MMTATRVMSKYKNKNKNEKIEPVFSSDARTPQE
jgi:hypothetical protein